MSLFPARHEPRIPLGTYRTWFFPRTLSLSPSAARTHTHVLGKTGSGKSYFLASLFLSLFRAGMPATLIDPHGDLARLLLAHLVSAGELSTPQQRGRLIYLDIPRAATLGRYLPFNYLAQPAYDDHAMAEHVAEAARRAWPELAHGAPTFENILKHSVVALRQAGMPLTRLSDLLVDAQFRDQVLSQVTDPQVIRFFRMRMEQWGREAPLMKESTLNRADLLTLAPVLRHALGHQENTLDFRHVIDSGTFVIVNLALPSPDARRLFGCLLTVGMESAALSRANVESSERQVSHHLILDEFSQFMAQSEESLTRMLSETRKYNLFCVMAHQNWSQASDRLKGALQNVGLEVILKAGRPDAEYSARLMANVDPDAVKHTVTDHHAEQRSHPAYYPLQEQWEQHAQDIQSLGVGEAFIRLPDDTVQRINTMGLPQVVPSRALVAQVEDDYLHRYFRPASLEHLTPTPVRQPAPITRRPHRRALRPRPKAKTLFRRPSAKTR